VKVETLSVAEAKRRFSELIDRVTAGERFVVSRRGKPAVALVSPSDLRDEPAPSPIGLAAVAGALAEWEELERVVEEIYASRRHARDRAVPDLG
jgi:prevent-host-death family protein